MLVGSGILYCWLVVVRMAGCDNGPLLGPCGHSKLHPPPQACCVEKGFLLWRLLQKRVSHIPILRIALGNWSETFVLIYPGNLSWHIYLASHQQISPCFSNAKRWVFLILRWAFYDQIYGNYFRRLVVNCQDTLSGVAESFVNIVWSVSRPVTSTSFRTYRGEIT